ncbi:MAG: VOC family protein [Terracidiphilus sp.]|jgi:predicted 3-demethylubiquinone-9 3-methyltransferase (glyoxalase superfamily)
MSSFQDYSRISPFLWFDSNAEAAADFYVSVFPNSRKLGQMLSSVDTPSVPAGHVLTVSFELDGLKFTALNGGPAHKFNDAVSFVVRCGTQEEIDQYWSKLTEGGSEIACGWLRDKFGLCWQIVPAQLMELIRHPKAMEAMMKMTKFDIAALERAAE